MRLRAIGLFMVLLALPGSVQAQSRSGGGGKAAVWTTVGAGAGFGVGLWAGLTAFDDAINSDRKVWTSALVGAAAGGTLGYLLGRSRRRPSPSHVGGVPPIASTGPQRPAPLEEREIRRIVASVTLGR